MRTLTLNMEDALISPIGLSILTGAGLIDSGTDTPIIVHTTETFDLADNVTNDTTVTITLTNTPMTKKTENTIYVMFLDDRGEIITEPYIPKVNGNTLTLELNGTAQTINDISYTANNDQLGGEEDTKVLKMAKAVLVDYYVEKNGNGQAMQVNITPDQFGGNYYIEASTLFRTTDGIDMPAEFIIPNGKVQSNFTFTMASSGDPSSFNFVVDAFPDYLRFDHSKKVLAAIQVITDEADNAEEHRTSTKATKKTNN